MWTDAFAQGAAAGGASPNPTVTLALQLLQFLPIFAILYFLLIRPEQQRRKQTEKMLKEIKKGDRVLTTGGLYGTIVGIDEGKVVLKISDDTKAEFTKSAIVSVVTAEAKP